MKLVYYPDSRLHTPCKPIVDDEPERIRDLGQQMLEFMKAAGGVGLAANQVGLDIRLLVLDSGNRPEIFVNPVLLSGTGEKVLMGEGCLSLPDFRRQVKRYTEIMVQHVDLDHGHTVFESIEGFRAHILQHEVEHLDGVMFIDHLGMVVQEQARKHMKKRNRK